MNFPLQTVTVCLVCTFFAVCFLQSALDKLGDWAGNLEFLKGHFSQTPLKSMVPMLLGTITLVELIAGLVCLAAVPMIAVTGAMWIAQLGLALCGMALIMLFFGQRMAKDYVGAANLAVYFGVVIIGLAVTSSR
jgi:hypothetical protein